MPNKMNFFSKLTVVALICYSFPFVAIKFLYSGSATRMLPLLYRCPHRRQAPPR